MEVPTMTLDAKHTVLFALYTEYQKDLPAMNGVTATSLGLPMDVFNVAVDKLQNEGFIKDAVVVKVDQLPGPCKVVLNRVMMTRDGIDYVEKMLEVQKERTGREKAQLLAEKFAAHGWNVLADLAARVFMEIAQKAL